VLSEHWILTAAQCFSQNGFVSPQIYAVLDQYGQPSMVYDGPAEVFRHPSYSGSGDWGDDLALVHLRSYGIDTSSIGKSPLYADSRTPWTTNSFTSGLVSG